MELYVMFLLLMFILIYLGITYAKNYAPNKIKIVVISTLILLFSRNLLLAYVVFTNNLINLYLFKPIVYLDILCFPILIMVCTYIFLRNNKINFNKIISIMGIIFLFYLVNVAFNPMSMVLNNIFGYEFVKGFSKILNVYSFIVYGITIFICIKIQGMKVSNKKGASLLILASSITIIYSIANFNNYFYMAMQIVAEIILLVTLNYALYKLKN